MLATFFLLPALVSADPKAELDKLQGEWVLIAAVVDGKPVHPDTVKQGTLKYSGDKTTLTVPHQQDKPVKAKVTVKPAEMGGTMEFAREDETSRGLVILAIYEWVDADTYKIAFHPAGKERPKSAESKEGTGHVLNTWQRKK